MTTPDRDLGLDTLLDLHGQTLFVDEIGHWMKFVVLQTEVTPERPHGLSYSLTLDAPDGARLVGFDNAHPVRERRGPGTRRRGERDHRHHLRTIRPYEYRDAATLLEDFWKEVDRILKDKGIHPMKTLKIGIADYDRMKARTMAIARGEHRPTEGEPTVWFSSIESFAKVLSQRNRDLLEMIAREKPDSLTELAELAGRNKSNLSRTLKTMSRYGLVELKEGQRGTLVPRVPYEQVRLDVSLTATPRQVA